MAKTASPIHLQKELMKSTTLAASLAHQNKLNIRLF